MNCPRAVLFDLDETLAPSLQSPERSMTERILKLLARLPVAIVTGRDMPRIQAEFLDMLAQSPHAHNAYIFSAGASRGHEYRDGKWTEIFSFVLTDEEKREIKSVVEESVRETSILDELPCYGERYVDKGSMLSFAMLGVPYPRETNQSWDPGNVRRKKLWASVSKKLPRFDVLMGGLTAIDVTRKGITKAYSVTWLSKHLNIPPADMLYVGDALYEGGNDAVVIATGIQTRAVTGPAETLRVIDEILASCIDLRAT